VKNLNNSTPERQRKIYLEGARGKKPSIPTDFHKLRTLAGKKLSTDAYSYIRGGAGFENTAHQNRRAFEKLSIVPRMLRDVSNCQLQTKLFGTTVSAPIFTCPIGVLELAHPAADLAVAEACAALDIPMTFSNQASVCMEDCARRMGDTPRWFQLYWSANEDLVVSFLQRAENCGCRALVVTLDTSMLGWRCQDLDQTHLPFLAAKGLAQYVTDPVFASLLDDPELLAEKPTPTPSAIALLAQMCHRYPGSFWENLKTRRPLAAVRKFIQIYTRCNLTWENLKFLRDHTSLPIVLKGILHPDDARKALDCGADGIYVSNHGGRQVDGAIGALDALREIVKVVDQKVPVLFDSGVRNGSDIFKAIAVGADAVGIGRPYAYALALAGPLGVLELLQNMIADLQLTMCLSGARTLDDVGPDLLRGFSSQDAKAD
jgi:lactate 2-monooxygenase